jgi:hypothetical protein
VTPAPPLPTTSPPAFSGSPAARIALDGRPLGIDPDGNARWLVRVRFSDASGAPTKLLHGGNVDFFPSSGKAQWQTRLRFDAPAAIVKTTSEGPLAVRALATVPTLLPPAWATTDTRTWSGLRVVAKALGPRMVQIGWFPRQAHGAVRIVRSGGREAASAIPPPSSTFRDATVRPGATYRYAVSRPGHGTATLVVHVPEEAPPASLSALVGKGAWLAFSPSPLDDDGYTRLDPQSVVDGATRAGLRYLELRLAYGEFWEISASARPTIDALIDLAADRGVAVIGWIVPREPTFPDLSLAVSAAGYRTARGTPLAGLAVDLERGEQFLGSGRSGYASLAAYPRLLRAALGPSYPIVAIVEDPGLEHLTNRDVPYAAIAASTDALQPMIYWRMLSRRAVTAQTTRATIRTSFMALRREARRPVPISVGGQTAALSASGAPPPDELLASLAESRRLGALGEAFFDWNGTSTSQWDAIGGFPW